MIENKNDLKKSLEELKMLVHQKNSFNTQKLLKENYYPKWIILDHHSFLIHKVQELTNAIDEYNKKIGYTPFQKRKKFRNKTEKK